MRKLSAPPGNLPGWGWTLLFALLCIGAPYSLMAGAQDPADLHVVINHQPAEKAFRLIERQTRLTFHFDKTEINPSEQVTLHFDKASLTTILEAITRQTGWVFQMRGEKILVLGKNT